MEAARLRLLFQRNARIGRHVVDDHRLAFLHRLPRKAAARERGPRYAHRHQLDVVGARAVPGHRLHQLRHPVDHAQPGHAKSPGFHGDPAGLAEQLVAVAHAHDQGVDAAEHGVDAVQPLDSFLGLLLLRLVLHRVEPARLAVHVARAAQRLEDLPHVDPRAVGPPQAIADLGPGAAGASLDRRLSKRRAIIRMHDLDPVADGPGKPVGLDADQPRQGFRPGQERAVGRGNHVRQLGHGLGAAQPRLAFPQRLLGSDSFADIAGNDGNQPGLVAAQHLPRRFEGELRAILAPVVALYAVRARRIGDHLVVAFFQFCPAQGQDLSRTDAQQLLLGVAEQPAGGLIDVDEAHGRALDDQDHVRRVIQREPEAVQLGLVAPALRRLAQLARDGGNQPGKAAFHDVVVGAQLHRLDRDVFADRSGNEDERRFRVPFLADAQRREAVESGHAEIRQHDVGLELRQDASQVRFAPDAAAVEIETGDLQRTPHELGVGLDVFDHQDFDANGH